VEKALLEMNTRILIVIDDIDRLPNDQIRLIFQLVNSVAGFPNVTYLLSFDKNIVARALSDVQKCDGEEYLEKIIQVPFIVPSVNPERIHKNLFSKLDSILDISKHMDFDKKHWTNVFNSCIRPFINSLRDVYRFFNIFYFQYSAIKAEVDFIDLAGITSLQVFAPMISKWINENKANLIGSSPLDGIRLNEVKENREKKIQEFRLIYAADSELMIDAIASLFPKFSTSVSFSTNYIDNDELRQKMRIASKNRFDIYFSLSLDEIDISRTDFEFSLFEMNKIELQEFIRNVNEKELVSTFLSELRCHLSHMTMDRIKLFVFVLFNMSGYLHGKSEGFFSLDATTQSLRLVNDLLYMIEDEVVRYDLLETLYNNVDFISFQSSAALLNKIELSHGKLAANESKEKQLITIEHLEILEKIFLEKLNVFIKKEALLDWDNARQSIYLWGHFDEKACTDYLHKALKDKINVVKFISIIAQRWTSMEESEREYGYEFVESEYTKYMKSEQAIKFINKARMNQKFWALTLGQQEKAAAYILYHEIKTKNDIRQKQIHELLSLWEKEFKNIIADNH